MGGTNLHQSNIKYIYKGDKNLISNKVLFAFMNNYYWILVKSELKKNKKMGQTDE